MTNMTDILAAHNGFDTHWEDRFGSQVWYTVCDGCDWRQDLQDAPATDHAAHVAEELTTAGYGNIPDALRDAANEWIAGEWASAFIAVDDDAIVTQASANWLRQRARLLETAAANLAAARASCVQTLPQ